ncbi:hypothetical protein ACI65C_001173 [Semiaphis heraclei]
MAIHSCPYEDCTSTFSRPYRLQIHIQRHQGIKQFQCTQCDRGYHRRQHLQRHIAEAHQNHSRLEQPLFCDHCDRPFNTAWGLRRHQAKIKAPKVRNRSYSCETCGRRFFNIDNLKVHSFRHKRFKCDIPSCTLSEHKFSWSFYQRHLATHHSEPFECHHCNEQFILKSQIKLHVKQHMPNYVCTQSGCGKTFAEYRYMYNHIQMCHKERTHKCSVVGCDWVFTRKSRLENHIKVHQQNGRIVPMAKRYRKKETTYIMANKLAALALKIN